MQRRAVRLDNLLDLLAEAVPALRDEIEARRAEPVRPLFADLVVPILTDAMEDEAGAGAAGWVAAVLEGMAMYGDAEVKTLLDEDVLAVLGRHPQVELLMNVLARVTRQRLWAFLSDEVRKRVRPLAVDLTSDVGSWLLLVVPRRGATQYHHQCAGLATDQRMVEGVGIPCEGPVESEDLQQFFEDGRFPYFTPAEAMTAEDLDRLDAVLSRVEVRGYWPDELESMYAGIRLDRGRLNEMLEAWIPVVWAGYSGVLLFPNSD